jgi:polyhydroxybutyrate depolymerase
MPPAPRSIRAGRVLVAVALVAASACSPQTSRHLERHVLPFGTLSRVWYSYRPPTAAQPGPVLVMLHGFHEAATDIPRVTGMLAQADRYGFTVVAPEGVYLSWNAGTCCGVAAHARVDDVGFLAALVDALVGTGVADPGRVYLAGFSNGAMMTYAFACAHSELLAGAAVVEGTLAGPCPPHQPLDFLVIHQTADPIVPFDGNRRPPTVLNPTGPFPSVAVGLGRWLAADGCPQQALPAPPALHRVARAVLSCPGPTITGLEVLGGGTHAWPHAQPLDASADLVRFFRLGTSS